MLATSCRQLHAVVAFKCWRSAFSLALQVEQLRHGQGALQEALAENARTAQAENVQTGLQSSVDGYGVLAACANMCL